MECSSNILEALLRNYWNLAKDQHLLLSIHTLLMQKQFSHRELLKNYFPLKYSLNVPWMSKTLQLRGNTQQIFPEYCVPAGLYVSTNLRRSFKVKRTRLKVNQVTSMIYWFSFWSSICFLKMQQYIRLCNLIRPWLK